jgi:hypothetical protein
VCGGGGREEPGWPEVKVVGDERFERPCGVESFARGSDGSKRRRRVSFESCVGRGGRGIEGGVGSNIGRYWDAPGGAWAKNQVEWSEKPSSRYCI